MGLLDQFLPEDEGFRGNLGSGISALGLALASSPNNAPFANLPQAMAIADRSQRSGTSRAALKALLMQAGYSAADAEQLSATEGVAKLAIDQKREQGFNSLVGNAFGNGAGGSAPSMTPPAPAGPAAGVSLNGGSTLTGDIGSYAQAIQAKESGGNYGAVGPRTRTGDRAYGAYQVMGANIPSWTREALGKELTPEQFVADKAAQDAVFKHRFGGYVEKYGNPQDAASAWFTGQPLAQGANKSDVLGTTGSNYVASFNNALKQQGARPQQVASAAGGIAPASGASVEVAENEDDVRRLELQMGMRPTSQTVEADMPAPGTSPAEYRIPAGAPAQPENATRVAARARMQSEVNNTLALIARTGMYGDRGKALADALKEKIKPLQKYLEPTDIERTLNAADAADPESARILRNSIQDSRPSTIQEYEYSRGDPAFTQYQKEMKEAGRSQVNIDQRAEGKFDEALGTKSAERFNTYIEQGDKAKATLSDIGTLRDTSRALGSLGRSAEVRAKLGPYLEAAGIKVDGLSDIQLFNSTVDRLAPQLRQPGAGATSDRDLAGFTNSIGRLSNSPEARERILDVFEAAARNQGDAARIATDVATKKITRAEGEERIRSLPDPLTAFREYRRANPDPADPRQTQQPQQSTAQQPAASMNATERAMSIRSAKEFVRKYPGAREQVLQRLRDNGIDTSGF